jgi:hypothetical protein
MAQVKIIGSVNSKQNHSYWSQQGDTPLPGPSTRHPLAPTKIVSDQQQQPVPDKGGA